MASTNDTIGTIASEIAAGLEPIEQAFASPERMRLFLKALGWNGDAITALPAGITSLVQSVTALSAQLGEIVSRIESGDSLPANKVQELLGSVKNAVNGINALKNTTGLPAELVSANFPQLFPRQLFDYLVSNYLLQHQPKLGHLLAVLGLIRIEYQKGTGIRTDHFSYKLALEDLPKLLNDPSTLFQNAYKWGTDDFDTSMLFMHLQNLFLAYGAHLNIEGIPLDRLGGFGIANDPDTPKPQALKASIFDYNEGPVSLNAGIGLFPLAKTGSSKPGLVLLPFVKGDFKAELEVAEKLFFQVLSSLAVDGGIGIGWRPGEGLKMILGFDTPGSPSQVNGELKLVLINKDSSGQPIILFGDKTASHISYSSLALIGGVELSTQNGAALFIESELKNAKIVIAAGEGDGFLQKILPSGGITANFDIALGLSTRQGFYFRGSAGLEIVLPTHLSLGPIDLENITLALKIKPDSLPIDAGVTLRATLGPLQAVVENIGITANLVFKPDNNGNLGPIDLNIGFKPPNGVGLSIDAGAVKGGGYLYFDFDKEEYAGALELSICGLFSAKAIGLITTKMPDGSKGFSMLIIITAEFNPPFQLGYGFTLIGVGGLLGLNRTMLLDPLRDAVRTGAVNSIMFPQNVIANAPRIISDLRAIFPPCEGKFLIGPMGKLGWGTPTLVSLSFGLIIEIPGNIAILGSLKIALPEERIALLQIQVLFVGTLDFDKKMLTFDASLYQSFILTMTLEGDMAVRLKWGDNPDFILTAGGFHPSYTPPPLGLPTLRRMAINILNTDVARIRVECYQALTSNTVQFGSKAELFFGFSAISINGHIQFDVLFQFSPFYFIAEVSASVSLDVFGMGVFSIRLRFSLEGPTPWRAKGRGSISFFFFDVSADFDITWGDSKNTSLPDIAILEKFLIEIQKKEQWNTVLSTSKNLLVSLRKLGEAEAELVLHPGGSLVVQQKLLPLAVKVDKIGNQKLTDIQKIVINTAASATETFSVHDVNDDFARAQYQVLSDADKLSKPSFEKMPGGVSISADGKSIKNGKMVRRKVEYEITIIDKEPQSPLKKGLRFVLGLSLFTHFLKGNSVARSPLSKAQGEKLRPFAEKMEVGEEGYTVAFQSNNKAFSDAATFSSEMMAQTYLQEKLAADPGLKKKIHIIPNYELQ